MCVAEAAQYYINVLHVVVAMPTVAAARRKKPARSRPRSGPGAPLPLRVLACFLAVPSSVLLAFVAVGWYVGVAWLAPSGPAWWAHTVVYSSIVSGFYGAFMLCVVSDLSRFPQRATPPSTPNPTTTHTLTHTTHRETERQRELLRLHCAATDLTA